MATTHVLVTGDSHTAALQRGLDQMLASGWTPGFELDVTGLGSGADLATEFFVDHGSHAEITHEAYRRRIQILPTPRAVARKSVHVWSGLFHFPKVWRAREWSKFRPASVPGREAPVSRAVVRDTLLHWFGQQLALMAVIRRTGVPVLALETPRPFRHHPSLRAVRPEVAIGLDRTCLEMMDAELRALGIPVLRIPPACLDQDGFMQERWRSENPKDPHHGNAEFGALMIRCLCEYLESRR